VPKTVKEDFKEGKPKHLLLSDLTKPFQEAAYLIFKLGLRYIWINSLCIVQDDKEEKISELPKIGAIYREAYIVIAASLAENGDRGIHCARSIPH
jgi:hypothetical protein